MQDGEFPILPRVGVVVEILLSSNKLSLVCYLHQDVVATGVGAGKGPRVLSLCLKLVGSILSRYICI
jgi:hypothetical protein